MSNISQTSPEKPKVEQLDYYAGVDLGQKHDHSVVAVVQKKEISYYLIHLHPFH